MKYQLFYEAPFGNLKILITKVGVRRITLASTKNKNLINTSISFILKKKLSEYFLGMKVDFKDIPLDLRGYPKKYIIVWKKVLEIPYGKFIFYKDLAEEIFKNKKYSRFIGYILKKNPIPIIIPCHRVIKTKGLGGYSLGEDIKKFLINLEKNENLT